MNLLHFPVDVLLEIAHWLDGDSLAECLLVRVIDINLTNRRGLISRPRFPKVFVIF